MSSATELGAIPDELRPLGEFRQLFQATGGGLGYSTLRGVMPIATAAALVWVAETWLVPRGWKYYLLCLVAASMAFAGVRALIIAWRRRGQKVAIFEHGFALWRHGVLSTYRWDQIEETDVSPAFYGFAVICHTDDGQQEKLKFDAGIDPTQNLRQLWRELEEQSARHRIPAALKALDAGEELVFVRKIWGKEVGTKFGISRMGIRATPRFESTQFLHWTNVTAVKVAGESLLVLQSGHDEPWRTESIMDVPGYVTLVAAAEHARQAFDDLFEQLHGDRVPAALAAVNAGQEVVIGTFGISQRGLRHDTELTAWNDIDWILPEFDHLMVCDGVDSSIRRLDYKALPLADRLVLWSAAMDLRQKASGETTDDLDDEDDEDEDEDEEESVG